MSTKIATEQQVKDVANTFTELYNLQGDKIENLDSGIIDAISPSSPSPEKRGQYIAQTYGEYINFKDQTNRPIIVSKEEYESGTVYLVYNDKYSKKTIVPIRTNGKIEEGNTGIVNGGEVFKKIKIYDDVLEVGNYIDTNSFVKGYVDINGNYVPSINWISVPYTTIPLELKGMLVCLSGYGNIGVSAALISIKDKEGKEILNIAGAGRNTPKFLSFLIPADAYEYSFTITNDATDGGIGTRPNNNTFINSVILNMGDKPFSFIPFDNRVVFGKNIYGADVIEFGNEIEAGNYGAVPSYKIFDLKKNIDNLTIVSSNLIDSSTFKPGYYSSTDGHVIGSLNWLRTDITELPVSIIESVEDNSINSENEPIYLTIEGGGDVIGTAAFVICFFDSDNNLISGEIGRGKDDYYPLTVEIPPNSVSYGLTIKNEATDGGIGTRPQDNPYVRSFQVVLGREPKPIIPYGKTLLDGSKIYRSQGEVYEIDKNEIVLEKIDENIINIYYCIGTKWIMLPFKQFKNEDKYIHIWRLDGGWICDRTDSGFTNLNQVILKGVFENAIYTSGANYNDALGSSHGWEVLNNVTIKLDNKTIDQNSKNKLYFGLNLTITTNTNFKTFDGLQDIGKSDKIWTIRNRILEIKNKIKWFGDLRINQASYLSMCSVIRKDSKDIQVTHTAYSNENLIPQDVSNPGFESDIYTDKKNPDRTSLIIWGDGFRAEMNVKERFVNKANNGILPFGYPDAGMFVQNTELYNKLYGAFGSDQVENGDIWSVVTEYVFNS